MTATNDLNWVHTQLSAGLKVRASTMPKNTYYQADLNSKVIYLVDDVAKGYWLTGFTLDDFLTKMAHDQKFANEYKLGKLIEQMKPEDVTWSEYVSA